jgi:hypothetical protein
LLEVFVGEIDELPVVFVGDIFVNDLACHSKLLARIEVSQAVLLFA